MSARIHTRGVRLPLPVYLLLAAILAAVVLHGVLTASPRRCLAWQERPSPLAEIAGDLVALQPAARRDFHLETLGEAMRAKCTASGRVRDALERRAAEAPPASQLLN